MGKGAESHVEGGLDGDVVVQATVAVAEAALALKVLKSVGRGWDCLCKGGLDRDVVVQATVAVAEADVALIVWTGVGMGGVACMWVKSHMLRGLAGIYGSGCR